MQEPYPQLNPRFVAGAGASQPREYAKPAYVSAEFVSQVATWISESVSKVKGLLPKSCRS